VYLRNPDTLRLAGPPLAEPPAKSYKAPITNGGQFIREDDADKVLTIISGPSPYQNYIAGRASKLPKQFLRIVSSIGEIPKHLRDRFGSDGDKVVGGTIDRATGTIYMLPPPGRRSDTRLEFALHEAVHLLAHPFTTLMDENTFQRNHGRPCIRDTSVGTFQRKFCRGFGEGMTQLITQQIMSQQGISETKDQRPYKEFIPLVMELMGIFSPEAFARAYFLGEVNALVQRMEFRWGKAWETIPAIAAHQPEMALAEVKKLEDAFKERIKKSMGPKGDFPGPSQLRKYASLAGSYDRPSYLGGFGLVKTPPVCPPFRFVCDPDCPFVLPDCQAAPKNLCNIILGASTLAETAAAKLEAIPLATDTVVKFRQIFVQGPLDPWEIPGRPSKTMPAGRMVAARLRMAAKELRDQDTLYRCVSGARCTVGTSPGGGGPSKPGGSSGPGRPVEPTASAELRGLGIIDPRARRPDLVPPDPVPVPAGRAHPTLTNVIDPVAVALLCRNEVWLCPGFWRMKREWQEGTLLHEMLHLCFGLTCAWFQHDKIERKRNNAYCYEAFALAVTGKIPEQITIQSCQNTPV
jgi:hypothetical protein